MKARRTSLGSIVTVAFALGGVACAQQVRPEDGSSATRTTAAQVRRTPDIEDPPWRDDASLNALPVPDPVNPAPPPANAGTLSATMGPSSAPTPPPSAGAMNDAQIVGVVQAIVDAELSESRLAVRRARDVGVRDLAKRAADGFGSVGSQLTTSESLFPLGLEDTATSSSVRAAGSRTLGRLRSAGTVNFDRAYVDGEIATSTRLLGVLDQITADAQLPQLRSNLVALRASLAEHLRATREIQERLARER